MSGTPPLVPCCPRCLAPLDEVPDDAAAAVLGQCPTHGDVDSGAEKWASQPEAVAINLELRRLAAERKSNRLPGHYGR